MVTVCKYSANQRCRGYDIEKDDDTNWNAIEGGKRSLEKYSYIRGANLAQSSIIYSADCWLREMTGNLSKITSN